MRLGTYHFNHTVAMDRIKRIKNTGEQDGGTQCEWLRQGLYLADYDFETEEYILKYQEDMRTITAQQARLLSYNDPNDLTPTQRKILWPDEDWG